MYLDFIVFNYISLVLIRQDSVFKSVLAEYIRLGSEIADTYIVYQPTKRIACNKV